MLIASPPQRTPVTWPALVAAKQIFGKGIHNKCLPYALGLAQVLHDQYKVGSVGIVYTWVVSGFPMTVGRHIVVSYTTTESGITRRWVTDNETQSPILVKGDNPAHWISAFKYHGNFTIDRVLQLPLTNPSDREYVGGALMAGTLSR
jgi:hypothetical protein